MTTHASDLLGTTVGNNFRLRELISESEICAVFRANDVTPESHQVAVQVYANAEEKPQLLRRLQEASFLSHPNVLRTFEVAIDPGTGLTFIASEPSWPTLADEISYGRFRHADVRALVTDVTEALIYLHSENLVFCNLQPSSICYVSGAWKLADFSQLQLANQAKNEKLFLSFATASSVPPEAHSGEISPAWDAWALGKLIETIFDREAIPEPFAAIVRGCLRLNPALRMRLAQVRDLLNAPVDAAPPVRVQQHPAFLQKYALAGASALLLIAAAGFGLPAWMHHREQAVPLEKPLSIPSAVPPQTSTWSEADRQKPGPEVAIQSLLTNWVAATRSRDVDALANCYAPLVTTFYGQHSMSRDQMYRNKQQVFKMVGAINGFDIRNVEIHATSPDTATVRFDKVWDFGRRTHFAGSTLQQLKVTKIGSEWKITEERDLKVYWVRHAASDDSAA